MAFIATTDSTHLAALLTCPDCGDSCEVKPGTITTVSCDDCETVIAEYSYSEWRESQPAL